MCIDKRAEFGEIFVYFSQRKRYLQFCELRYPMCIICIRRGTNIIIVANVRTIQELYKNFTRSCLYRKKYVET